MDEEKWKEMIETRKLDPETVFFASFIAGLNEFGILNQMVMKVAGKTSGTYMARCFKACYPNEVEKEPAQLIKFLNDKLNISGNEFSVFEDSDRLTVKIRTDKCRYCPKGVGGAELEGTICPFPGIIESFVNAISDEKISVDAVNNKLLNKEGGFCVISFKKEK